MIDKQRLVKKLHLNQGFSIIEVAEILEETKIEVQNIVDKLSKYAIITNTNEYYFHRINDEEYRKLRKISLPISYLQLYMFPFEIPHYLGRPNIEGIPELYAVLSYFFGEAGHKPNSKESSFSYKFHLRFSSYEYLLRIIDISGRINFRFYKIAEGEYNIRHDPFPELKIREMKKIWFWFMAFVKNSLEYMEDNNLLIKPFCRKIPVSNTIYGYKDNDFFFEEYTNGDSPQKKDFEKLYEENKGYVAQQRQDSSYQNQSSAFISQIIEKTNQKSMPNYELEALHSGVFRICYRYLEKNKSDFSKDEIRDEAHSLSSDLLYYFAFKDDYDSKQDYFAEINSAKDLKIVLERAEDYLKEEEYNAEELHQALEVYKENYRKGREEDRRRMIKNSVENGIELEIIMDVFSISKE